MKKEDLKELEHYWICKDCGTVFDTSECIPLISISTSISTCPVCRTQYSLFWVSGIWTPEVILYGRDY